MDGGIINALTVVRYSCGNSIMNAMDSQCISGSKYIDKILVNETVLFLDTLYVYGGV